jgi:hypothetical protein
MGELVVSSVLWDANSQSQDFSRVYTDEWATRLFNGFRRHLTIPHRSVLFTDRLRDLPPFIDQIVQPDLGSNGYGDCVRPFILDAPMVFTGLDTVIVGNCDKLARYCLEADRIALPKHPYEDYAINGVVLTPAGHRRIFDDWRGENDMKWMRCWPHNLIDNLWPGRVLSYKAHVRNRAFPNKASIIYFHGDPKMSDLPNEDFVKRHWI